MLDDLIINVLMSKLIMDHYTKEMHLLKSSKADWEKHYQDIDQVL